MSADDDSLSQRERRLDEAVTAYLRSGSAGAGQARAELLAGNPDLAEELVELFDFQDRLYLLATPLRCVARAAEQAMPELEEALAACDGAVSPSAALAGEVGGYEQMLRMADALAQLPEDQRRAVELRHLRGGTVAEVAEQMGRSKEAVAKLLLRGVARLRKLLGGAKESDT